MKLENLRKVKVPLSVDEIKEFFSNKDLVYHVNYADSDLKGVVFLTYLSNLDLPAEIDFAGSSYENKSELFKIYLTTRNIIKSDSLRLNIANILLSRKGIDTSDMFINMTFSRDEIDKFILEHTELLNRWEQFLESTIVFAHSVIPEMSKELKIKESFEIVDDPSFVGANIVNFFSIPMFLEYFYGQQLSHELRYFRPQFEDYMFRGKNLYSFYVNPENLTYGTFLSILNETIELDQFFAMGEKVEEMLGQER